MGTGFVGGREATRLHRGPQARCAAGGLSGRAFAQRQHGAEDDDAEDDVAPGEVKLRAGDQGAHRGQQQRAAEDAEIVPAPAGGERPPTSTTAIAGSRKRWPMLRKETVEKPVISTPASAEQKPLSI